MTIKKGSSLAYSENYKFGTSSLNQSGISQFVNDYQLVTFGHKHDSLGRRRGDVGGPFQLTRTNYEVSGSHRENISVARKFSGNVIYTGDQAGVTLPALATSADLNSYGATAISRVLPTNPSAGLATFTGELLGEGIPAIIGSSLLKDRVHQMRKLPGDEYLGYQFGWAPLVSDLQSFAHSVKHHKEILDAYRKGSDKKIKRRHYIYSPPSVVNKSGSGTFGPNVGYTGLSCNYTQMVTFTDQRWFEGAFRYHIPVGDSQLDKFKRYEQYANILLGTRITPEVVWNVSPWTWFADWFGNAGDVIHNISQLGSDGLAMQYGYVMSHKRTELYVLAAGETTGTSLGSSPGKANSSFRKVMERKQRVPGTPYGFGLSHGDFTNRQLAIMAALGMSYT